MSCKKKIAPILAYIPILLRWGVKPPSILREIGRGLDGLDSSGPVIQREFDVMLTSD